MAEDSKSQDSSFPSQMQEIQGVTGNSSIRTRQEVGSNMERRFMSDRTTNIAGAGRYGLFPMFKTGGMQNAAIVGP